MAPRRVLFLSASAGAGHVRAAEALLAYAFEAERGIEAVHLDALDFVKPHLRKAYSRVYLSLVRRAPSLWSQLYRMTNDARPGGWPERMRRRVEANGSRRLLREIAALAPDVIVCTHFLPAELLSQQTGSGSVACPVWVQVTDFDLHRMWVHPNMTGYLAPCEEVAYRMRGHGIAPEIIHVTGIPIMPAFAQQLDRTACARELGFDPAHTTVLLMGGGAGLGGLCATAEKLLAVSSTLQLIVVAGKNAAELNALQALEARHQRLAAVGFTSQIERLMACADFAVTKPGGATTAECLAMGLPMVLVSPIPGQEDRNANYLLEHGVALRAFDLVTLEYRVRHLLAHPGRLAEMARKARALSRPHAGAHAAAAFLGKPNLHHVLR